MAARILPDSNYLHECFIYDGDTGILRWRLRPRHHFKTDRIHRAWNTMCANKIVGSPNADGHLRVGLDQRLIYVHRVVWKMHYGTDPIDEIDHKNRNPTDNRIVNLRAATQRQNAHNHGAPANSTTGLTGVRLDKRYGTYGAHITIDDRQIWLGSFATIEAAHNAYAKAAREHFGDFAEASLRLIQDDV